MVEASLHGELTEERARRLCTVGPRPSLSPVCVAVNIARTRRCDRKVRDSLGGIKATPEGSRTLATGASPWNRDNGDARAPEARQNIAANHPCRSASAAPPGLWNCGATRTTGLRPWLLSFAPIGAETTCPPCLLRSRFASPGATFLRPFGVNTVPPKLSCIRDRYPAGGAGDTAALSCDPVRNGAHLHQVQHTLAA